MKKHTVVTDNTQMPTKLDFSPVFNVAVPFIDRHIVEGRGEKVIIRTTSGEEVTYSRLVENVNRVGNLFKNLGLRKGDRVVMIVKDCPEFFYVFWGAIKAGIIPIPINTLLRAKDYSFIISDSGCTALIYSPNYKGEVESALELMESKPEHCVLTEGENGIKERLSGASSELEAEDARADDDCFLLYSSGSTGNPKGAVHRHRDMVVTSQYYGVETLGIREDDTCFSAAKLFFAYGHGNAMHFPLWVGATTVLFDGRPTPDKVFEAIEKFKPTLYFGVPTLYAAQLMDMESNERDVSSVRVCVSAGEGLPSDIFHRWHDKTGLIILDGIGSTEILHIFISNRIDDYKPGSSGRLVTGYEAKILDEKGTEAEAGDSGQLLIKGGSTAARYWNNPGKTAHTMQGEWLNTGDTYIKDGDGYYHYCGRNDDMLKVGGIWCSPFEIESKLMEHPKVLEAAVTGHADEQNLIKPKAFIVLIDHNDASPELDAELLDLCKKDLAPYKYPRWFSYENELPKTATGKIQRFKLR